MSFHRIPRPWYLLAATLAVAWLANPARAGLIVNGSFEQPAIAANSFSILGSIPGWTGIPNIEVQNNVAGSPFDGNQHVELDTTANSAMSQAVPTVPGQFYELSFAYSPRPGIALASNGIDVFWDGVLVASLAQSGTALSNTQWQVFSFNVVGGAGATTTLRFNATGTSNSVGGYLDAVEVQAVPEPTSLAVLGLGGLTLGLWRLRRRKAA